MKAKKRKQSPAAARERALQELLTPEARQRRQAWQAKHLPIIGELNSADECPRIIGKA